MLRSILHSASKSNVRYNSYKISPKFQYISDIHLEYRNVLPTIKPIANNLALLGDIGNPFKENYLHFMRHASQNWDRIFIISGNHEYWQSKYNYNDVDNKIQELVSQFNNIHFLNNTSYECDDYIVLGTTLWSKINKSPLKIMGDDLYIKSNNRAITFDELNNLHVIAKNWLSDNIYNSKKPLLILTHHLPSYKLIIPKYKSGIFAPYQDRFASDLDHLIKDPVKFWLCGHSHCNIEMKINNILCGINAFGYNKQSELKHPNEYLKFIDLY
ncbi:metallo-dependent phosphatase [Fadolivirus algeromassiliense]|jgi:hypothetical protein|uniref:Metallo-dependent phosphatase n=1 Tax=Fadolivirus FV1/VV64 TaxID=3070911 RepID=A0A7D3UQ49_9VIRU|nr:metallo-dependent phosphatase [Fadolivirus algeromassiliense]QKF94308.1 metallo-dependent phosphatase [Fadolivirus FV1/VV64]